MENLELMQAIRELRSEVAKTQNKLRQIEGQWSLGGGNKTFTQQAAGQVIPTPQIQGGTWYDSKEILGELIIKYDADDSAPTTITPADDSDEVTFSNDIIVNTGTFAATTVKIGDQAISESDYLIISNAATPGIVIKDTGDTLATGATGFINFVDSANASIISIKGEAQGDVEIKVPGNPLKISFGTETQDLEMDAGYICPKNDNGVDLGKVAQEFKDLFIDGTAHIDTLDVDINATVAGTLGVTGNLTANELKSTSINTTATVGAFEYISSGAAVDGNDIVAFNANFTAADPSAANSILYGLRVDMTGVNLTNNPTLNGIRCYLPATYGGGTEIAAVFGGDGKTVQICTDTYALYVSAGDVLFNGSLSVPTGNIIMGGTGGDDERLQLPYLTGIPASVANGSIWVEADGLHYYRDGAERVLAGI